LFFYLLLLAFSYIKLYYHEAIEISSLCKSTSIIEDKIIMSIKISFNVSLVEKLVKLKKKS